MFFYFFYLFLSFLFFTSHFGYNLILVLPFFFFTGVDHEKEGYDKLWPMRKRARERVRAGARARASGFVEEGEKKRRRGGTSNTNKKINTRSDVSGH